MPHLDLGILPPCSTFKVVLKSDRLEHARGDFASVIGVRSKSKNHYLVMIIVRFTLFPQCPELGLHFFQQTGSIDVHWTTHHPRGLSDKDTFMARYCDEQARLVGTVDKREAQKCDPPSSSQM